MYEIVVISGKGGTGKTSIVAAFAALTDNAVLADCDVDAADLHLLLQPEVKEKHDFIGGKLASVIGERCIGCGRCAEVCNFNAVTFNGPANEVLEKTYAINPVSCEGCGVCFHFCPANAIKFEDAINGRWFVSNTRFGPMVHAKLGPAQENSGKLVSLIRKQAKQIATEQRKDFIIVDGSPGIGCPVIASITAADLVLVVTEPTVSAQHDLERVIELTGNFKIPTMVCINKCDINLKMTEQIIRKMKDMDIAVISQIPYDVSVTKAQVAGQSIIEYSSNGLSDRIESLWQALSFTFPVKDQDNG